VALLEARDRIGGRTFTEYRPDGTWVDRGGAWIGPGQDRVYALMDEFGVPEYKQHNDGDAMMIVDGKKHRYGGTIPWTMSPWAVANLGVGLLSIENMCKSIPCEAPWEAKQAAEWDRRPLHLGGIGDVAAVGAAADGVRRWSHLRHFGQGRRPGRPAGRRDGRHLWSDGRRTR
jgi:monoamine oxidase